jgi:hypothetical protein
MSVLYVPVQYSTVQSSTLAGKGVGGTNPGPLHHPIGKHTVRTWYEPSTVWEHGEYVSTVQCSTPYSTVSIPLPVLFAVLYSVHTGCTVRYSVQSFTVGGDVP